MDFSYPVGREIRASLPEAKVDNASICLRFSRDLLFPKLASEAGRWMENFVLQCMPVFSLPGVPGRFYGLDLKKEMIVL